jgi:hypothetical protein
MVSSKIKVTLGEVTATAEFLEAEAPRTTALIWGMLPLEGKTGHSIECGREVFMILENEPEFFPENQTINQITGDLLFYYKPALPPPHDSPIPVISFIYGRDSQIRTLHGPVPVNLFARITNGLDLLADESIRMKKQGYERMRIEKA